MQGFEYLTPGGDMTYGRGLPQVSRDCGAGDADFLVELLCCLLGASAVRRRRSGQGQARHVSQAR